MGLVLSVATAAYDPMLRDSVAVPALMMVSAGDQVSALFDNAWYNVGDKLQGSEFSIVSIDSENAVVVLSNGMDTRTVQLWY